MFYYKHHIGDYRRDTGHLSLMEHGAYRQLLDLYYVDEKPIPNETEWVMRRLSAKTQVEKDAVTAVLSDFFTHDVDGWHHKRCDFEIQAYEDKADKNKENGKLGGRPKKKTEINPEITQSVLNDNPSESKNNLNLLTNKPTNQLTKEPKGKKAQAPEFVLPKWIDQTHWDAWHMHPKRKNLKPEQKQLAIDQLAEWRDAGIDYALALKNSATSGWQGLFKPDINKQISGHVNKQEALEASNRAVVERLLAKEAQYAQQ